MGEKKIQDKCQAGSNKPHPFVKEPAGNSYRNNDEDGRLEDGKCRDIEENQTCQDPPVRTGQGACRDAFCKGKSRLFRRHSVIIMTLRPIKIISAV